MNTQEQKNIKAKLLVSGIIFFASIFSASSAFAYQDLRAPVNVKATVPAVGQIKVSFDDNNDVATEKNIVRCYHGYYIRERVGGKSPITLSAEKDGTKYPKYTCTVSSVQTIFSPDDTYGPESARSNEVDPNKADAVIVPTAPSAPQSVTAVAGDKQATITWMAPYSDGNSPITKYTVSSSTSVVEVGANGKSVDPSTAGYLGLYTYVYTGLTNDVPYTFYVRAENIAGPSGWASSGSVTPKVGAGTGTSGDGGDGDGTSGDGGNETGTSTQKGLSINIAYKNPLQNTASDIPSLITVILKAVAKLLFPIVVIMILYAGFLFVIARGNIEKIGDAKKALTYALVGGMIVLGAYGLAQIVQGILVSVVS